MFSLSSHQVTKIINLFFIQQKRVLMGNLFQELAPKFLTVKESQSYYL